MMNEEEMTKIFKEYDRIFGVWLCVGWNLYLVDWEGLAKEAEKCIHQNKPMVEDVRRKFFGPPWEEGNVY